MSPWVARNCLGVQDEAAAFVEIHAALGGVAVGVVFGDFVFEAVAGVTGWLGSGYSQQVTKLAQEGLAVSPFGSGGGTSPGNERFGTLRRHERQDSGSQRRTASHPLPIPAMPRAGSNPHEV
jgi:hypothetical protein